MNDSSERSHPMMFTALVCAAVAAAGYSLFRRNKTLAPQGVRNTLVEMLTDYFRERHAMRRDQCDPVVQELLTSGTLPESCRSILRIEFLLSKAPPSQVNVTLSIAEQANGQPATIIRFQKQFPWRELEDDFRSSFIKEGAQDLNFLLYETKGAVPV